MYIHVATKTGSAVEFRLDPAMIAALVQFALILVDLLGRIR